MKSSTHSLWYFFFLALLLVFINPQKGAAQLLRTFSGHHDWVQSVAFSPDGTKVLSGGKDNTLKLWETATGKILRTFSGHDSSVESVAFSPDGTKVLSGSFDKTLKLWETATGRHVRTFSWSLLQPFSGHSEFVTSVAFSPDGTKVLSGSEDGTLKLWETATGKLLRTFYWSLRYPFSGHDLGVTSVAFSHDGTKVLSGSKDRTIKLWETASGKLLLTFSGHDYWVESVAFSPDGTKVLSGSRDNTLKLWETATGKLLRAFYGHDDYVESVAFSPDGTKVLSGSDNTLKLWETATGRLLRTFSGHDSYFKSVAFSPDGTKMLSGGWDNLIKLWAINPDAIITGKLSTISPEAYITEEVQKRIQTWQQKGKYETTQAYRKRVTETKRSKLIRQYTTELVDSLGRARFNADIKQTDYDADNQVFEVTFADNSSIYVNVPVSHAPAFDQNLDRLSFSDMDFTLTSGGELVLRKAQIHNPANDQTYAYDSGREIAFNTAELAADFDPIDMYVQSEDVGANVTKGTKRIEVGNADVDVNIPETAMSKPNGIAVVIGNRRYQGDTPDVDYAVNDAKVMRDYLIKTLGFRPGNILYEENASLSRMRVLFGDERNEGKLANYLKPGRSDVFVFYSGHGAPDPNTETGYLVPVDGDATALYITGYPLKTLYDNLGKLNAKSVSVVIDACFSGASGGGEMLVDKASPIGIEVQNPAAKLDNGFVVTASSGSQISSWYPEKGHGLLTYFWLKALQGAADQNGDGAVTASEIRAYLNDNTNGLPYWARRLHNREQTPQVFISDGDKVIVQHN